MMRQTTLWDTVATDRQLHRASDPETSKAAAERIADSLHGAKAAMYRAFSDGPKTAQEAAVWCVQNDGKYIMETYRKRYLELRSSCLIRPSIEGRNCRVTGFAAVVWEVVK